MDTSSNIQTKKRHPLAFKGQRLPPIGSRLIGSKTYDVPDLICGLHRSIILLLGDPPRIQKFLDLLLRVSPKLASELLKALNYIVLGRILHHSLV